MQNESGSRLAVPTVDCISKKSSSQLMRFGISDDAASCNISMSNGTLSSRGTGIRSAYTGLAAAFLWRIVRGRLTPGRYPRTLFVTQTRDNGCWQFYLSEEIRRMACPPFKLVRHPGRIVHAANYLGGFRDV
jgi:hypothetical protein